MALDRRFVVPLAQVQACAAKKDVLVLAGVDRARRVADEASGQVWRGECGLELGIVNRGRR